MRDDGMTSAKSGPSAPTIVLTLVVHMLLAACAVTPASAPPPDRTPRYVPTGVWP